MKIRKKEKKEENVFSKYFIYIDDMVEKVGGEGGTKFSM